jgi:hypothetical protein
MGYYSDVAISCYKAEFLRELQNLKQSDEKGYIMVMEFLGEFGFVTYKYDNPEDDMYLMCVNCKWGGYKDEKLLMSVFAKCKKGAYLTRVGEEPDDIEHCTYIGADTEDGPEDMDLYELVRLKVGHGEPCDKYNYILTGEPYFEEWNKQRKEEMKNAEGIN